MNPMEDLSENENLWASIAAKMLKENPGTNFERCFQQHFNIFHKYVDSARKEQRDCFPDTETYLAFSCAKLFFDKLKFAVFQKEDETQINNNEDHGMPPLEAFHNTKDEIEMKKNRILKGINKGDILHLKVVQEDDEHYKLQILNKYGDKQRIIDCSLFALLFKDNSLVKNIRPPLQIDDLVRATAFGNVQQEMEKYKMLIVSLNSNDVIDNELKSLHLGRIYKKDILHYPEDVSNYSSFGEYLKAYSKFQSPESIVKQICAFGCDPLKTGPLYETRYKRQISVDCNRLSEAAEKLSIISEKTQKASDLLKKDKCLDAFLEIQDVLDFNPDNDLALTLRGKIYLALSCGRRSRKVKKAFLDFEAALKINCFNEEAAELREAIIMESCLSFTEKNMPEKAKKIQDHLRKRSLDVTTLEFLKSIKKRKATHKKVCSVATDALSSEPVPNLKEKPKNPKKNQLMFEFTTQTFAA